MDFVRKIRHQLQWLWKHGQSGYGRVWLQSRLFPPPPTGRFPPLWMASVRAFPPLLKMDERPHALLAIGGSLTEDTLLAAYLKGIYPVLYEHPVKWIVFNPRMVLFLEKMKLEKRLRRLIRSGRYHVTFDSAFEEVARECSNRKWTWLVPERINVAVALHKRGQAHSVEVWNRDGKLVGGLFGLEMGRMFLSESAFHHESNVGKVADAYLNCHLQHWGYEVHDAQVYSPYLEAMGFEEIPCKEYVHKLQELMRPNVRSAPWRVDERLDVAGWNPSLPGSQIKGCAGDNQMDV
ncbi:MAG: leucyl/phenylalanyl-tRNA--protein transferase [Verrucomicrobia bacterium]|nr:MAG: leucyl/phenylalanyl-tRNA--protein transferase [Verrucomicrobiota bacterium]